MTGEIKNTFDTLSDDANINEANDDVSVASDVDDSNLRQRPRRRSNSGKGTFNFKKGVNLSSTDSPSLVHKGQQPNQNSDDVVYADSDNEFAFEWIGGVNRDIHKEHPSHIFKNPQYWRYLGYSI